MGAVSTGYLPIRRVDNSGVPVMFLNAACVRQNRFRSLLFIRQEYQSVRCSFRLVGLLLIIAATGYAQTSPGRSALTGVVQDQMGAAIVGAKVELSGGGVPPQSTTTDRSGGFRFPRVPPAKYQLRVSSEGFEPATVEVTVGAQPAT